MDNTGNYRSYLPPEKNTNKTTKPGKVRSRGATIMKAFWVVVGVGIVAVFGWFGYLSTTIASFEELENPNSALSSEVVAADGTVYGRYFIENRVPVTYDEIDEDLKRALIATEDERYMEHSGIDMYALGRVAVKTVLGGDDSSGGGSTITQQLAKLLYERPRLEGNKLSQAWTLINTKFREWLTALKLERSYTKEEIMTMYFNQFDFINGAYGIKSASQTYFGKPQDSLNIEEAAMLVGMFKNPALFNPRRFPERAKSRRNTVFYQMLRNEEISRVEYDSLVAVPLEVNFSREDHNKGLAPYFREELRTEVKRILAEKSEELGRNINVHTAGLRIYTTIDPRMQEHAEAAVREHMVGLQEKFWKHWEGKDPWTYQAEDNEKAIREKSFRRQVQASDRYTKIRQQYRVIDSLAIVFKDQYDLDLRDYDIDRMIAEDTDKGYISRLLKQKLVSKDKAATYRRIRRDEAVYSLLKSTWQAFNKQVEDEFSKKTKMTVFAYNEAGQVDTTMTPYDSIRYHRMFLQTGVMAVDPKSGEIKAWVGGTDYSQFKFDHVNSRVERQVGSTFKPFVYATSILQQSYSPCSQVNDQPVTIFPGDGSFELDKPWTPKNSNGTYTYKDLSLYDGLKQSKNTVSVYLMKNLGTTQPVRDLARNLGIDVDRKNYAGVPRVPTSPSIALGAVDLSVFEMTGAYATFANNGVYNKPHFVTRIEDKNGNILYQHQPTSRQVIPEVENYVMVQMLKRVMAGAGGFGGVESEIAGKTGTTNKHADGWFMGLTPEIVVGTWVGGDDRWVRFRSLALGQGARMARPIFANFLKRIEKDPRLNYDAEATFTTPKRQITIETNCANYTYDTDEMEMFDQFGDELNDSTTVDDPGQSDTDDFMY